MRVLVLGAVHELRGRVVGHDLVDGLPPGGGRDPGRELDVDPEIEPPGAYVIPHIGHRKRDVDPQVISELCRRLLTSGHRKADTNTIMFEHWKERVAAGLDVSAADLARVTNVGRSTGARALARYRAARYPSQAGPSLSPKTIASIHIMLRAAFNDAASKSWRVIAENPVPHASRPRVPRANRTTWKPAELTAFLRVSRGDRLYAMWLLFATTGVRRSEVADAQIAGLDLQAHELSIGPTRVVAGGRAQESDGKRANSVRAFGLDPVTIRVLRGHLDMLSRERAIASDAYHDHGLLFCWADGGRIYPDTITRQFNRLVDRAGRTTHWPARRPPHVRDDGAACRREPQDRQPATWTRFGGIHPRDLHRQRARVGPSRSRASREPFLTSDLDLDPSPEEF
jgi:integrase